MNNTDYKSSQLSSNPLTSNNNNGFRSEANWFYWIAALSLVNSISAFMGNEWVFAFGLGITQIIDSTAMEIASTDAEARTFIIALAFALDILASVIFMLFGWLANNKNLWAFFIGIVLYFFDGLIFIFAQDWMGIGVHAFALFFLFKGYISLRHLLQEETRKGTKPSGKGIRSPLLWLNLALVGVLAIIIYGATAPTPLSGKTIMSGTIPHEMSGDISEKLRKIAKLPDSGWTDIQIPKGFLKNVLDKTKDLDTFSVLTIFRSEGTATPTKVGGIDGSWRADCVRPDKMHVSQSLWDADRELYLLDEWVTLAKEIYQNAGLWWKPQDKETIERLSDVNNSLLPEVLLSDFMGLAIEHSGLLKFEETSYVFLQTAIREEQGIQKREQVWIDEKSQLIRKHRIAFYENNAYVGEQATTFIGHTNELSISAPEWLNLDSTMTVVNTSVCIVEHW